MPPNGLGLVEAEEPRLVQQLLVLADEHAGVLGGLGALAAGSGTISRARRIASS